MKKESNQWLDFGHWKLKALTIWYALAFSKNILGEISRTERDKYQYHMTICMWNLKQEQTKELIDTENQLVATEAEGGKTEQGQ